MTTVIWAAALTTIISLLLTIIITMILWNNGKIVDAVAKYKSKELERKLDKNYHNKKEEQARKLAAIRAEEERKMREERELHEKKLNERKEEISKKEKQWMNEAIEEINKLRADLKEKVDKEINIHKNSKQEELKYHLNVLRKEYAEKEEAIKAEFEEKSKSVEEEKARIQEELEDLKRKENAAVNARIREYEEQNKEDFYKIQISSDDLREIDELEKVIPKLKNPIPLRKAIYSIYYQEPVKDLCNRLTDGRKTSGIYKITNLSSGKCYIGKSVDISKRLKEHTKAGAGAANTTRKKLYDAMWEEGIHNFKYEIIEEVERDKLKERENYWMEYFAAKVYGYSSN